MMAPLCPPRPAHRGFASPYDGGMGERSASPRAARIARGSWGFGPRAARTMSMSHCRPAYHASRPGADHDSPNNKKHGGTQARCVAAAVAASRQRAPGERHARQPKQNAPRRAQPPGQKVHGKARGKRGADTEQSAKLAKGTTNTLSPLPARTLLSFGTLILLGVGATEVYG